MSNRMNTGARTMSGAEWGMVGLLSIFWGGSFLFNGIALKEVPVFGIVASRLLLGALLLHLVLRLSGVAFPHDWKALRGYAGMAILNGVVPYGLIVFGQTKITSGLASILNATTPIFTMLLAHILLDDEKLDLRRGIGVLLGFAGVFVLFFDKAFGEASGLVGLFACLAAAFSYGLSNIFGRQFLLPGANPVAVAAGQLTFGAAIALPLALLFDNPFAKPVPSGETFLALALLGLVSTGASYILYFRILLRAGATNASLVTLLIPCSAILFGAFLLGERLGMREFLGFAIIAAGLLVIDGRMVRLMRFKNAL